MKMIAAYRNMHAEFNNKGGKLTNWIPVSLRIPTPAEAKLAPLSSFCPLSSRLKYGNGGSDKPISRPDDKHRNELNMSTCSETTKQHWKVNNSSWNLTDEVWDDKAISETACRSASWVINSIRGRIRTSSCNKVVVVSTINKWITKYKECSSFSSKTASRANKRPNEKPLTGFRESSDRLLSVLIELIEILTKIFINN